jgi:hypothetical protein
MTKKEFQQLRIGDYVQVTTHGQNKGKIGVVDDIVRWFGGGSIFLKPYNCEFGFTEKYVRRTKNGVTSFHHENVRYLGKSPIIPVKRISFDDMETTTEKGRFMVMLVAHITGTTHSNMTPQQTIEDLYDTYYEAMFGAERGE